VRPVPEIVGQHGVGSQQNWSKEGTVRHCQSKEASILWLPGERDNAKNRAMHAGEEDHARPGWTTSIPGRDYPWKS